MFSWRVEKNNTARYTNLQGYREPYSRRMCIMDDKIFLIPKREHPPTIKANEARSTWKIVARISKKLVERSVRRPVTVTLIKEYTQQSRKKTLIEKKS